MTRSSWAGMAVVAAALTVSGGCGPSASRRGGVPADARDAAGPSARGTPGASSDADGAGALAERIGELEAALRAEDAALRAEAGDPEALPAVEDLMQALARLDGPGMEALLEALLLRGEAGFAVLHEFLHQADVEREKILTLTHDPQLILAMLRIAALYPEEVAAFSSYLMTATRDRPQSFIRREVYNFLPVFLRHHKGRFPEFQKELEADIVHQLASGGEYLYKIGLAVRDLEFHPPIDVLMPILLDPEKSQWHPQVIEILARRHEGAAEALVRFAHELGQPLHPSVRLAMRAALHVEEDTGTEYFRRLLEHPDPLLRAVAHGVYFELPRDGDDVPLAVDFLNSEAEGKHKQSFVGHLKRRNPEVLELVAARSAELSDPAARELVEKAAGKEAK